MTAAEVNVQAYFGSWLAQKHLHGHSSFTKSDWHIPAANALYKGWQIAGHQHALLAFKCDYFLKM